MGGCITTCFGLGRLLLVSFAFSVRYDIDIYLDCWIFMCLNYFVGFNLGLLLIFILA